MSAAELWAPYDRIVDLARLSVVRQVEGPEHGRLMTGVVNSAGDAILRSDHVRTRFSSVIGSQIDGTGINVGVISDGVANMGAVQGGGTPDLPAGAAAEHSGSTRRQTSRESRCWLSFGGDDPRGTAGRVLPSRPDARVVYSGLLEWRLPRKLLDSPPPPIL